MNEFLCGLSLMLFALHPAFNQDFESITLIDVQDKPNCYASSALNNDNLYNPVKYGVAGLFDDDTTTCWAEGADDEGEGVMLYFTVSHDIDTFYIYNGYGKTANLFKLNNRVKSLEMTLYAGVFLSGHVSEVAIQYEALPYGQPQTIVLKDRLGFQPVVMPYDKESLSSFIAGAEKKCKAIYNDPVERIDLIIALQITDVYKGEKWNDTCISEIKAGE